MTGIVQYIDRIKITLQGQETLDIYVDVFDNSLARRWLPQLNGLLQGGYHLEKNYCWLGWPHFRTGQAILDEVNRSMLAINDADIGYTIDDYFTFDDVTYMIEYQGHQVPEIDRQRFNRLHRYFEDLQGHSAEISGFYQRADATTRWHIRQLNLLCHEFECWFLSWRKRDLAPDWIRPSQLMCWLNAPRFDLEPEDYALFGVDTINRSLGGVYVGVNKAVGKHHWEVFNDEGRDSRINELTTSALRSQTEAAGDFDIEWGIDPSEFPWQQQKLSEFRDWLRSNGFDPEDPFLTIGHPKIGQVDLVASFGTQDHRKIWKAMESNLNVAKITTSEAEAIYEYSCQDPGYYLTQIDHLKVRT